MIRQRSSFVTACGTTLLCACATGTEVRFDDVQAFAPENGSLVTLVDYLESGRRAVDRFLQGLPAAEGQELGASIVRAREACVRIAVRHHLSALSYNQVSASGVLVAKRSGGPVVLTAAGLGSATLVNFTVSNETRSMRPAPSTRASAGWASAP